MTRDHDATFAAPDWTHSLSSPLFDRRRLIGWATGAGAALAIARTGPVAAQPAAAMRQVAALPASDHTWLLASPDAIRPEAPGVPTETELAELLDLQAQRTDATTATVLQWAARPAVFPWLDLAQPLIATLPPGLMELRAQSLLRTAMHDAVVAARDAQTAHARPAPAVADDRLTTIGPASDAPSSFPSDHAAVAGAAATVLDYLFPDASDDGFAGLAEEAATSRLWAGANYRSDVVAGLALGRAVGELAAERGRTDGSDAEWDGSGWPTGDGYYVPTPPNFVDPPFGVLAGTWATWVLPSGDAIRPAPFPAYGSPGWNAEVAAVQAATAGRTPAQERTIDYWLSTGPTGFYTEYAQHLIERERLDEAQAASVVAMVVVAQYDALVAVWDAKYHYWVARPLTVDPDLNMYIPTPPYPSYPAGFSSACGAGASVLANIFPAAEADLMTAAREGAAQRCSSGVHYVLDNEVALVMGGRVGRMVVETVRAAGAADDA